MFKKLKDLDLAFMEDDETYRNRKELCRLPCDKLSDEAIAKLAGKVKTYRLSKEELEELNRRLRG
ncbi:hypothetical protein ABNF65_02825 [Paenibacillus larvae]